MIAPSNFRAAALAILGPLVLAFVVYTARAEGDDHIGEIPASNHTTQVQPMPERPDVILITVDTLRADRLGAYGYADANTPNIDGMARSGVVFANAIVPLPRTTPALASLLSGLGIAEHGSREVWQRVDVEEGQMLAEVFQAAGYATLGLSANSAAGSAQGLAAGFDEFRNDKQIKKEFKRSDADVMTELALALVDGVAEDKPVFMWVHYVDPHWKYGPPRKHWKDQPSAKKCRALIKEIKKKKYTLGNMFVDADNIASNAFDDCSALYDSEVAFADHEIGRLIDGLRERGRWNDAVRVFTADHGENMGEDGLFFAHGPSLADGSLRVPLIIAGPTVRRDRVDGGIAIIEDVAPTLLDLANIDVALWPEFNGSSLRWRWDDDIAYPPEFAAYARAESGGALHPDTTIYVVSGRKRSKYCYHSAQYSMCFDARKHRFKDIGVSATNDDVDDDGPEEPGEGDVEEPNTNDDTSWTESEDVEFYDHVADPLLKTQLETIPEDERALLVASVSRWSPESARLRAIRDSRHKLVAYPLLRGGYRYALYDLRVDPAESTDVREHHPRKFARMKAVLDDWGESLPTFVARKRTESELDELRALGYVQ